MLGCDETSTRLIGETRPSIRSEPVRPERYDYEYRRHGTRNLFVLCEPKDGWRPVEVTEQRTVADFAQQMRWLGDEAHADVGTVRVVLDNLNTHKLSSTHEANEPSEARRIARRLELTIPRNTGAS